jgi:hypothetical protein
MTSFAIAYNIICPPAIFIDKYFVCFLYFEENVSVSDTSLVRVVLLSHFTMGFLDFVYKKNEMKQKMLIMKE